MPEESAFQTFTLPPGLHISRSRDPAANKKLVQGIMGEAFRKSVTSIETALENLDELHVKRLQAEADSAAEDPHDFLYNQFRHISAAYTGYRTGLAEARNPESGMDVTKESISTMLNFLSYLVGPTLTGQFFEAITNDIDAVLEQRYGRQR